KAPAAELPAGEVVTRATGGNGISGEIGAGSVGRAPRWRCARLGAAGPGAEDAGRLVRRLVTVAAMPVASTGPAPTAGSDEADAVAARASCGPSPSSR